MLGKNEKGDYTTEKMLQVLHLKSPKMDSLENETDILCCSHSPARRKAKLAAPPPPGGQIKFILL